MEEGKQININGGPGEYFIREGAALTVSHPKSINITGILGAPFQFFEGKKDLIQALYTHDQNPYTTIQIIGQLKKDTALEPWKITSPSRKIKVL